MDLKKKKKNVNRDLKKAFSAFYSDIDYVNQKKLYALDSKKDIVQNRFLSWIEKNRADLHKSCSLFGYETFVPNLNSLLKQLHYSEDGTKTWPEGDDILKWMNLKRDAVKELNCCVERIKIRDAILEENVWPPQMNLVEQYFAWYKNCLDVEKNFISNATRDITKDCTVRIMDETLLECLNLESFVEYYHIKEEQQLYVYHSQTQTKSKWRVASIGGRTDDLGMHVVLEVSKKKDAWTWAKEGSEEKVTISLVFDETSFRRMDTALVTCETIINGAQRKGNFSPSILKAIVLGDHSFLPSTEDIIGVMYSNRGANMDLSAKMQEAERKLIKRTAHVKNLDTSQIAAVLNCIFSPLSLVLGPPGTGKTVVVVEMITNLFLEGAKKILMCAQTNACVDDCARKLLLRADTISQMFSDCVDWIDADGFKLTCSQVSDCLKRNILRIPAKSHKLPSDLTDISLDWKVEEQLRSMKGLSELQIAETRGILRQKLLSEHKIIMCTLSTTQSKLVKSMNVQHLVVDESSQASELELLQALARGFKTVSMVGDHKQLCPTVMNPDAISLGLRISCFEKLFRDKNIPRVALSVQFRMHPDLSKQLVSFYDGKFTNGACTLPPVPDVLHPSPSLIVHADSTELPTSQHSFRNIGEAFTVVKLLCTLLKTIEGRKITVLSFYRSETSVIQHFIRRMQQYKRSKYFDSAQLGDITVSTVDGFQGKENDVIVLSMVRSNTHGDIGFVAMQQRMVVAISRARVKMIVVCNCTCFLESKSGVWKQFIIEHLKANNVISILDLIEENNKRKGPKGELKENGLRRFAKKKKLTLN